MRKLILGVVAVLAVASSAPVARAYTPYYPDGSINPGVASHAGYSACGSGYVCISPYIASVNACRQTPSSADVCHIYNFNGNSGRWAGRPDTQSDPFGASVVVGSGSGSIRNRQSTSQRTACAFSGGSYYPYSYTTNLYSTVGFQTSIYSIYSLATIPNAANWACA